MAGGPTEGKPHKAWGRDMLVTTGDRRLQVPGTWEAAGGGREAALPVPGTSGPSPQGEAVGSEPQPGELTGASLA